jgi:hypothetical protein
MELTGFITNRAGYGVDVGREHLLYFQAFCQDMFPACKDVPIKRYNKECAVAENGKFVHV